MELCESLAALNLMMHPTNLKQIKDYIKNIPDEVLEQHIVFKFTWGDEHATRTWTRKETPKQYWKRKLNETK